PWQNAVGRPCARGDPGHHRGLSLSGARRRSMTVGLRALAAALLTCLATPASAHGFGQRYDLPIPLSFYVAGVAAAIVVSFLIVGLFVREVPRAQTYPRIDLLAAPLGRWIASPPLVLALKLLSLAAFIVTILAVLRRDQNPYRHTAPTILCV